MTSQDYFSFKSMISLSLIKTIYIIGAIIVTLWGVYLLFGGSNAGGTLLSVLAGIITLVFGNIMWRVTCEIWIVFFSIHERLGSIETEIKSGKSPVRPAAE
jgi:hypothetical protein